MLTLNVIAQDPFITTWKTDNAGSSSNTGITIPTIGAGYLYDVDWDNDGTYDQFGITGDVTHDFGTPGIYTFAIRGDFPRIYFNFSGDRRKIISIDQWGDIAWQSMESAFYGCENLIYNASDAPNLNAVSNFGSAFKGCALFNGDINNWDVNSGTDFNQMFYGCRNFNQPLNNWDVSAGTDFSGMLAFTTLFNQPLNNWDVSSGSDFSFMFSSAKAFNQDISNWVVSNGTDFSNMFVDAVSFNQPLNNWDVSSGTNFSFMFALASSFNQSLNSWDVSSGTFFNLMFRGASAFNQNLNSWNVSAGQTFQGMFNGASSFNQPLDNWNLNSASNLSQMFKLATVFNQSLNSWDVSSVSNFSSMFENAVAFNQPLDNWDLSSAVLIAAMFENASSFNQNLGDWSIASVLSANFIFDNTNISVANYDSTLIGWSALSLSNNVVFGAEGLSYCNAEEERQSIIDNFGWTFSGDSKAASCATVYEVTLTGCDSILIGNNWYTSNQNVLDTVAADSIVDYTLIINDSPPITNISATACDSFVWNGTSYFNSGNYIAVEQANNGCDSLICLDLTINYSTSPLTLNSKQTLFNNDAATSEYGVNVALDGDWAVVGAYSSNERGAFSGSAFIYQFDGNEWIQTQKLVPADLQTGDFFGIDVAISGDFIFIGAPQHDAVTNDAGAVYVYKRDGSNWSLTQKLLGSNIDASDNYGRRLSVDGDFAAVGAFRNDSVNSSAGAAFVYKYDGANWLEEKVLVPSSLAENDFFGGDVAISGKHIVVGAFGDDTNGSQSGAAYIFERTDAGWQQQQKLMPADGNLADIFGNRVAISGNNLLVSAWGNDEQAIEGGAVYFYQKSGLSWSLSEKLLPENIEGSSFGTALTISGDKFAISAIGDNTNGMNSGSVYIYENIGGSIERLHKFDGEDVLDYYGFDIQLNRGRLFVGAVFDDTAATDKGAVYVYDFEQDTFKVATCAEYTFDGDVITSSGIYQAVLTNSIGCDSSVVIDLTIYPTYNDTIQLSNCSPADTGVVIQNDTTIFGCDSITYVITNLAPSYTDTIFNASCNPMEVGTIINNDTSINGCDSITTIITNLVVSFTDTIFNESCNPMEVGTVINNDTSINGCDSITTIITNLVASFTDTIFNESCNPIEVGTVINNDTSINGCDSIITIITNLVASYADTIFNESCNPTEVGTVMNNDTSINGCDSITTIITNLVVSYTDTIFNESCNPMEVGTVINNDTSINGCDSITTIITNLVASYTDTIFNESCNPTEVGTVINNDTSINGCDSITTIITNLVASYTDTIFNESCNPMEVGTVINNDTSINGCDSITTTITSLIEFELVNVDITSCAAVDTGIVRDTLMSTSGCDSIVVTTTSYQSNPAVIVERFVCDENEVDTTTAIFTNVDGCDSMVTTILKLAPKYALEVTETSCIAIDTGITVQMLSSVFGCDSMVTTTTILQGEIRTNLFESSCFAADTGTIVQTLMSTSGCDSIVTIRTDLLPVIESTIYESSCNPNDTGTFVNSILAFDGCDSIVNLVISLDRGTGIALIDSFILGEDYVLADGSIVTEPGEYQSLLTNNEGCDSLVVLTLLDITPPQVNIPNTFTPNDDGVNDILYAYSENENIEEFKMLVFDRLGELVFKSEKIEFGWNGQFNNKPMNMGIFLVEVYIKTTSNEIIVNQRVKLIR